MDSSTYGEGIPHAELNPHPSIPTESAVSVGPSALELGTWLRTRIQRRPAQRSEALWARFPTYIPRWTGQHARGFVQ